MFSNVGWGEVAVLLVLGLLVFGPEKLPRIAADAGRMVRQLRDMASGVSADLKAELGPEVADLDLRSLHPRTFLQKQLLDDDDAGTANGSAGRARRSARADADPPPYDEDAT